MCKICIARHLVVDIFLWCNANFVSFPSGTLVARQMRNGRIDVLSSINWMVNIFLRIQAQNSTLFFFSFFLSFLQRQMCVFSSKMALVTSSSWKMPSLRQRMIYISAWWNPLHYQNLPMKYLISGSYRLYYVSI